MKTAIILLASFSGEIKKIQMKVSLSNFAVVASVAAAIASCVSAGTNDSGTPYKHFIAHNETFTCSADSHATPFNNQIRGVNLGGWMVLEPWITPSLFYQFLGGDEKTTAMDMYSFCEVLGPVEGNKQLRRHWEKWLTVDIVEKLAESGAVNSFRLPVGDWMYKPYGPFGKNILFLN